MNKNNLMHRIAHGVTIVGSYNDQRIAYKARQAFPILEDKKGLSRIIGEGRERFDLIGKAEKDFYYLIARSLTSTRNDIGQYPIPNGNGDIFIHTELTRASKAYKIPHYKTFERKGVFTNHQSDKVECCFGLNLSVRFVYANDFRSIADTSIHNLLAIDKEKAKVCGVWEGISKNYQTTWSMGCDIGAAICTVCGNRVTNEKPELCEHISQYKCGEMVSHAKEFAWYNKRVKVGDLLIEPVFAELSLVTVPADYTAETQEVLGEVEKQQAKKAYAYNMMPNSPVNAYNEPDSAVDVERYANIEPNGDGTYTVVWQKTLKKSFGDYQTALDYIASLKSEERSASYDNPGNFEYNTTPNYDKQAEDECASDDCGFDHEMTDVLSYGIPHDNSDILARKKVKIYSQNKLIDAECRSNSILSLAKARIK